MEGLIRTQKAQNIISLNYLLVTSQTLEEQVKEHERYKQAFSDAFDWLRKARIEIQQCSDCHGEKDQTIDKEKKMTTIIESMNIGMFSKFKSKFKNFIW